MSVQQDSPILPGDVLALFAQVNGLNNLPGQPYSPAVSLGEWAAGNTYAVGNWVVWQNSFWICTIAGSGNQPCQPTGSISAWGSTTHYTVGQGVTYTGGQTYYCSVASVGVPPTIAGVVQPGWILVAWNPITTSATAPSAWSSTTAYVMGQAVGYNGWNWICAQAGTNNPPMGVDANGNPVANAGWVQEWLQCYNRMRTTLAQMVANGWQTSAGGTLLYSWQLSISGGLTDDGYLGWPCQSPSLLYNDLWFYFLDTGGSNYVTLSVPVNVDAYGLFTTQDWNLVTTTPYDNSTTVQGEQVTSKQFEIIIGGDQNPTLNATFQIPLVVFPGSTVTYAHDSSTGANTTTTVNDTTDPLTLVSVDSTQFLGTFTKAIAGYELDPGLPVMICSCIINGAVTPGRYKVTVNITPQPDNTSVTTFSGTVSTTVVTTHTRVNMIYDGSNEEVYGFLTTEVGATLAYTATTQVATHGIHPVKQIYKIKAPSFNATTGVPFGVYSVEYTDINAWDFAPFPPPQFGPVRIFPETPPTATWSTSTSGVWFGQTPPIQSGGMDGLQSLMQWNQFLYNSSGAIRSSAVIPYTGGYPINTAPQPAYAAETGVTIWERQPMPCSWLPFVYYPVGFTIQDSNGNLQTVIGAGRSGTVAPTWATTVGQQTQEPIYNTGGSPNIAQAGCVWQLAMLQSPVPAPAQARRYSVSKYPAVWQPDLLLTGAMAARLVPNMTLNGYGNSSPISTPAASTAGWWVYRVYLNRINPTAGEVPVTLGCIRNGAFVAFGTYLTGTVVPAMWPVFGSTTNPSTGTLLVYQCSERVDVQATILTCGLGFGTWGSVSQPIMLAYWLDILTILSLPQPNADGSPGAQPAFTRPINFNSGSYFDAGTSF